jgi:hypothetical protein
MKIIGEKYSQKKEEIMPCISLNTNFLKEYWLCSHAGWENSLA